MKILFIILLVFYLLFIDFNKASSDDYSYEGEEKPKESESLQNTTTFDYYVCGPNAGVYQSRTLPRCTCTNNKIVCKSHNIRKSGYDDYYEDDRWTTINFKSLDIKIMAENFIAKNVTFEENEIPRIKKDKILKENAATVEFLFLPNNKITKIENGTFDEFTSLKHLDISQNQLKNISDGVFSQKLGRILNELVLSHNQFRSFNSINFSHLINLETLDLSYNSFHIRDNDTTVLPKALSNLKILYLNSCGIHSLNETIFANLLSLQKLYLYSNPLLSFPTAINALPNLQYLNLEGTEISNLNNTSNLKIHAKLETLIMISSGLKIIDDCAFCSFPNLKKLHLWRNHGLTYIHENAFGYAYNGVSPPLESFSLEYCNLSTIPENLLDWSKINAIGIEGNPFQCNCSLAWLINDLTTPSYTFNFKEIAPYSTYDSYLSRNPMKCSGPHALRDTALIHISGKFCLNEKKKEYHSTTENYYSNFSYFFAIVVAFIFGFVSFPIGRYCIRLRKQKSLFFYKNEDDKILDDFDDGGTSISNV